MRAVRCIAKSSSQNLFLSVALLSLMASAATARELVHEVAFVPPVVTQNAVGHSVVTVSGCETDVQSGKPLLPTCAITIELPTKQTAAAVTLERRGESVTALTAPLAWGQPPLTPNDTPTVTAPPDPNIYDGQALYPSAEGFAWRVDTVNGRSLLSVLLYPVLFDPPNSRLLAAAHITIKVELQEPSASPPTQTLQVELPQRDCSYLIIAPSNLIHTAAAPWNLQGLCERRAAAGFTTGIVDVAWICDNFSGDNVPAQIRAFLQQAHRSWGTRYLLLVGTFQEIPAQQLYVRFTDFILVREAQIPADAIYYGCLDGPFDGNGNGLYGEINDGLNGGDVDLAAELMVGRFPVATTNELARMVRKTVAFESIDATAFNRHALMAEKVDLGTTVYATGFLEELRQGANSYAIDTVGFDNSPYADHLALTKLYDSDELRWGGTDSLQLLNDNFYTIHHLGHGAATSCFKLNFVNAATQLAVAAISNTTPYLVYSQACRVGAFDQFGCVAERIVTAENIAAAAVMNAREGWEFVNVIGGYSHRFHRCFLDAALSGKAATLGAINERSRRMNLPEVSPLVANYWRYVYYELNLFGDPATPFAPSANLMPATIEHTALLNTFETNLPYRIACTLEPIGLYNPTAIELRWRYAEAPQTVYTQSMARVVGNTHAATIPTHPTGTTFEYAIVAQTHAAVETRWPAAAEWSTFRVTDRLTLQVHGSPDQIGAVVPEYGSYWFADDYPFQATAPQTVAIAPGSRYYCSGFSGSGNIPQAGTSNSLACRTSPTTTMLLWHWQRQHSLTVAPFNLLYWSAEGSRHPAVTAPAWVVSNEVTLAFAGWQLDGQRLPPAPGAAPLLLDSITADAPHQLTAHYLPRTLDVDGNNIADWYELRYYGAIGQDPNADDDGDGFTLAEEFADYTDPWDAAATPAPPLIHHQPLAEVQTNGGPFAIIAEISDSHSVTNAAVVWRRAIDAWQVAPLELMAEGTYRAVIAPSTNPGDDFEYFILAEDPAGHTATTDVYFFWLVHPQADTSRFHDIDHVVATSNAPPLLTYMNLHNNGNAPLEWSITYGLHDNFTRMPYTWQRDHIPAANSDWSLSTNRYYSPPTSMHSTHSSAHSPYTPNIANLTTPPLTLGARAKLTFVYWIQDELARGSNNLAWDGGIVEISTNDALAFTQLPGPYTHAITNWTASPWPADTPCFSGSGSDDWQRVEFDLSDYAGHTVHLRFSHGGDNNNNQEGWYIDDVSILTGVAPRGFAHNLPHDGPYTMPAGQMQRILWSSTPLLSRQRDDLATIFLRSNDPTTPLFPFDWHYRLRDQAVDLCDLSVVQTNDGSGRVTLQLPYTTVDPDPVVFTLTWHDDTTSAWQPLVVTNPPTAAATNTLTLLWESQPLIAATTQLCFEVSADNGYFVTNATYGTFTVDNLSPQFESAPFTYAPMGVGDYVVALDNSFTLFWPPAHDNLPGPVTYTCRRTREPPAPLPGGAVATTTNHLTYSNIPVSHLDATNLLRVVAYDAFGNSNVLSELILVLNPATDYDHDTLTSGEEWHYGWDATTFTCPLWIERTVGGGLALRFPTVVGKLYTIEATPSLSQPQWQPLPGYVALPGSGTPLQVPLMAEAAAMFYRVILQEAP